MSIASSAGVVGAEGFSEILHQHSFVD